MSRSHPATLLALGALGACLAFLAVAPGATDAGAAAPEPPTAVSGEVSFYSSLVPASGTVHLRAASAARRATTCRVRVALLSDLDRAESRVMRPASAPLWSEVVVLQLAAGSEAVRDLRLPEALRPRKGAQARAADSFLRVSVEPQCTDPSDVG